MKDDNKLFATYNFFSFDYYESIIEKAISSGYSFLTFRDFARHKRKPQGKKIALLRHDLDDKPQRLEPILRVETALGVRSSIYVLVHTNAYNFMSLPVLSALLEAESHGFEIGLHTNFVETSQLLGLSPDDVIAKEIQILRCHFEIDGVACHRGVDFMFNSLPYLDDKWATFSKNFSLTYHAYDDKIFGDFKFVNEGLNPHLGWRSKTPEEVIESGENFCLSTHPHWWHRDHAFED